MKRINLILLFVCTFLALGAREKKGGLRPLIDLQGIWQFKLDPDDKGIELDFPGKAFSETVILPGTTDTNKKGIPNMQREVTTQLSRLYSYVGKAWYKKEVEIPREWKQREVRLILERTKPTRIWVDGREAGRNDAISTRQIYDLTRLLSPGKHTITILVDNGKSVPPQLLENSHAYTEATQTNWNGVIGRLYLEARDPLHIADMQLYPDAARKTVRVKIRLSSPAGIPRNARIVLSAQAYNAPVNHEVKAVEYPLEKAKGDYEFEYPMGEEALLWSEFHPALYILRAELKGHDAQSVCFGLRDFAVEGTQFAVNGHPTFLRGKHDACVFPLTAHTAMDLDTWRHYFRVAKSYGINHYRFHSWCPPEACFEAADLEGIYLQPELPFWGVLKKDDAYLISFLKKEGIDIQNTYGNHPSFVMFALGNELSGDQEVMTSLVDTFRRVDGRHLYAFGSNNYLGFRKQQPGEDYRVTCRLGAEEPRRFDTHTRGSFSFADTYDGGYINHTYPNTVMDFSPALAASSVPVVSHETGQFQVYPDYRQIAKYTGVLYPYNMEIFRQRLEKAGMLAQAGAFFEASGKWAAELYKADIEMDLRTPGFGGFQLLDLQDYPGQGSAYVGILDAFMESKGLITPERWRGFCCEIVPLFLTEKFCWTRDEPFVGTVKVANYSEHSLEGKEMVWKLKDLQDKVVDQGALPLTSRQTGLLEVGVIRPRIDALTKAQRLNLEIGIAGTPYSNSYALWVYPGKKEIELPRGITATDTLSAEIIGKLRKGESVLWFPRREQYDCLTVGGLFQTDYWNYRMFKNISENNKQPVSPGTLGILADPGHPLFAGFPTDFHTNWQWFPIIKQSYPLILDRFPEGYKPIVQVIDNIERNHKLGLVFELAVEEGKLLVCMSDLRLVLDKPEARQFYSSMLQYMASDEFRPETRLKAEDLTDLLHTKVETGRIGELKNISYE